MCEIEFLGVHHTFDMRHLGKHVAILEESYKGDYNELLAKGSAGDFLEA